MSTLREQAQQIMSERGSQTAKREKLLKIGLTNSDIQQLFFAERLAKKIAAREQSASRAEAQQEAQQVVEDILTQIFERYTFGVEIECYNVRPSELCSNAQSRGLDMQHEGYNHTDNDRYYKLVSDGSICGVNPIECVSPILNGNNGGLDTLKACCDSLNAVGAKVNKSTGLHVHVGGRITQRQYINTFINYYYLESVIDTFMAYSRRNNRFAKQLNGLVNIDSIFNATDQSDICEALHHDRYYKINCMSWMRHRTIEFRQHQGTTDYDKISNWARFCIKLVHWSEAHVLTTPVATIDDIAFLTDEEKAYFKGRANTFAELVAA